MYSVSKEMTMDSFQVIQPADNQTDFTGGQICRLRIPRSVGFFDSHLSRLQFLVSTENANYKMAFVDPVVGVASMIDMIRVSQNGTIISEILEYATLQKMVKTYSRCLTSLQRDAQHKGIVDYNLTDATGDIALSSNVLLGSALAGDGSDGMDAAQKQIKFQLELDMISLFEIIGVVPMSAMGDILLEIRFVPDSVNVLKVLPATGIVHDCAALTNGDTTIVLTPAFQGFTCLGDSPFVKGMKVATNNGAAEYEITAMSQAQGTGVITLTINPAIAAGDNGGNTVRIVKGTDDAAACSGTVRYVVNKVELALQVVRPPASYVEQMAAQVRGQGLMIDTDSYTTYRSTLLSGVKNQTVQIPTTQSRAKAVFSVPRSQESGGSGSEGSAATFTVNAGGTGYNDGTILSPTGGSGFGLKISIQVAAGVITGGTVIFGGVGYEVGDVLTITGGNGNGRLNVATLITASDGRLKVSNGGDRYLGGLYSSLLNYRYQINGKYYPTQPIDLKQFAGGFHFAQEHLRELEKAFQVAGVGIDSMVGAKQNFVIARALAKYGASMDLSDRPVQLYLEYSSSSDPDETLDVVSFVHHNIRIAITEMGVEVMS